MYLKGYLIKYDNNKVLTFPKWDFGGDKSNTNRVWNKLLTKLKSLPHNSYPMSILDLDKEDSKTVAISNPKEFEYWLKYSFEKVVNESEVST